MALQTPIGRARGLGAAREGTRRWMAERLTGIASLILVLWFVFSAMALSGADYHEVRAWLGSPVAASLMVLLILSVFYHTQLGLQVVIEDYQRDERRIVAMVALNLFTAAVAGTAIFAILKIAFGAN